LRRSLNRARWGLAIVGVAGIGASIAGEGCSATSPQTAESVGTARQPIVGGLTDPNITTAGQVVNRYSALALDAAAGTTTITVTNAVALNVARGDLLFVIQMQGALVDGTNTNAFGSVTSLNGAGSFEMVTVDSALANVITLSPGCGLKHSYSAAAHTQVVWVPQYSTLTVGAVGSITAPAWNGTTGGVVAIQAGTVALGGSINVTGLGFRGGALTDQANAPPTANFVFRSTDGNTGGEKGESIAGFEADYDMAAIGGRFSLGAIGNGGGGGAAHNGGGGGGANGDNGNTWLGAGVMPDGGTDAGSWLTAWALDPDAIDAGGPTHSSGGGRGGYSYSANAQNPLTVGPNNTAWGGDDRQYRGGLGGRPLANDPLGRVFPGGGGGGGNANNGNGGAGGQGGGIVYLVANSVSGAGALRADGSPGNDTTGGGRDGPGGGGGGGSIVVVAPTVASTVVLSASGGNGGIQNITGFGNEAEGPGGGGGGGFVAAGPGATAVAVNGGAGGSTNSPPMVNFTRNGTTDGAPGLTTSLAANAQAPMCIAADLAVTMTDGGGSVTAGSNVTYTIVVTNNGPNPATGATVADPFGANFGAETWTCVGAACPAASGSGNVQATLGALAGGATVTFTVTATVAPTATGTLSNTVTVTAPAGVTDGTPANNTATTTNPVIAAMAGVTVALTNSPTNVTVGAAFDYTLTISNAGPNPTFGGTATLAIPTGVTAGAITSPGSVCLPVGQTLTCTLPSIAGGGSITITQAVTAPATVETVTATATAVETIGGTQTATDTTTFLCAVDNDCGSANWCTGAGACAPKAANGQPVPAAAPISGICNPTNGARGCVSAACDTNGNVCGIKLGDGTCTVTAQCIAGVCAGNGTCELADAGGPDAAVPDAGPDASAPDASDAAAGDAGLADAGDGAVADAADGAPEDGAVADAANDAALDAGSDAASSDAGDGGPADADADAAADAASDAAADGGHPDAAADAASPDAGDAGNDAAMADAGEPQGGALEGGGCSCETAGSSRHAGMPGGIFALAAVAGILGKRRRRRDR
jgi:uncharacterized repeat protein (TIGR01451 family)/MYXO-CTERM domain-containing protein